MLPTSNRLTKERDFKKINAKGKSFFSPLFKIRKLSNEKELSRFGFVVTTKTTKKATERNAIKRQVREIVRLSLKDLAPGFDAIVTIKKEALGLGYQELEKDLKKLLKKAGF